MKACALTLYLVAAASLRMEAAEREDEKLMLVDVLAITANVNYHVKDATLEEAVRALFNAAGEPDYAESVGIIGPKVARVSLDLENIPVMTVLDYIAELGGCYPVRITGIRGVPVFNITFNEITMIDDSDLRNFLGSCRLTLKGAERLGIKQSMNVAEITALFRGFGIHLDSEHEQIVFWNTATETLAVRAHQSQLGLVAGIATLANSGYSVVKDLE